jgi:DNA repair ATPase RecN
VKALAVLKAEAARADPLGVDESDRSALGVELLQLKRREPQIARHLEMSRHRAASFPSDFVLAELRKLTVEHAQLVERIGELERLLGRAPTARPSLADPGGGQP